MSHRSKYPDHFGRDALELVKTSGRPAAKVARSLGITEGTLWSWVNADREAAARAGEGTH